MRTCPLTRTQALTGNELSTRGFLPQQLDLRPSQSQDMYVHKASNLEKKPLNSVKESLLGLELNMRLSFQAKNVHGTFVYQDPFKKFLVKLEDVTTPFEAKPFVNFQEDSYMSVDGARYLYTEEPWSINNLGVRVELPCTSKPGEPGPLTEDAKRPSIGCEIDQFIKDCPSKENLIKSCWSHYGIVASTQTLIS